MECVQRPCLKLRGGRTCWLFAEVVRRFEVVAVQEVRRSARAFLAMMTALGLDWAYPVTDVTDGKPATTPPSTLKAEVRH